MYKYIHLFILIFKMLQRLKVEGLERHSDNSRNRSRESSNMRELSLSLPLPPSPPRQMLPPITTDTRARSSSILDNYIIVLEKEKMYYKCIIHLSTCLTIFISIVAIFHLLPSDVVLFLCCVAMSFLFLCGMGYLLVQEQLTEQQRRNCR
jgi:hypothetical protein